MYWALLECYLYKPLRYLLFVIFLQKSVLLLSLDNNQGSRYILLPQWLYPRHTKYVGVYSFRFSVRPFVRSYVRSFVRSFVVRSSFRHRVKVFALKFIRPHILKTLWWILFIYGMMVDIGLKFLSAPSPPWGWPWEQGHGLWIFVKKSQGQSFCVKVYKTSYFEDPLMDFIHIWHVGRYRSKVFISTIPTPGVTLGTRSRT